jgi:putative transcription antitermination factor YqgF
MSYLGLDIGSGSVGVAISMGGDLAQPLVVVDAREWKQRVGEIIRNKKIETVVVGIPKTTAMDNENMVRVKQAISYLEKLGVVVERVDESSSTGFAISLGQMVAERGRKQVRARVDDTAAALVLQRYLDIRRGGKSVLE